MTISYQFNVHTASFAGFAKLLSRWKGSVYKLVWKETVIFGLCYALVSLIYRNALTEPQRRDFENIARHIGDNKNLIPLTFVLGFYVQFVVTRWWDQYNFYPWPDRILNLVIAYIPGTDVRSRIMRRTLARWTCLSTILLTRGVSVVAKKRFPTLERLIEVGLMTQEEVDLYETVNIPYAKYWVPMLWFTELLKLSKREKLFMDDTGVATKHFLEEIAIFRSNQWRIWSFDWISVPLVYTQVTTLATYGYFFCCLFSRQFLDPKQNYESYYVDFYFPVFTFLQFFFYVGWLKVAESLINPWGEDDDDFEVNWFIDRHVQVSFLTADEKFGQIPTIVKDSYWNTTEVKVPYNSASALSRRLSVHNIGSAVNLEASPHAHPGGFLSIPSPKKSVSRLPNFFSPVFSHVARAGPRENRRRSSCLPSFEHLQRNTKDYQANGVANGAVPLLIVTDTPQHAHATMLRIPSYPVILERAESSEREELQEMEPTGNPPNGIVDPHENTDTKDPSEAERTELLEQSADTIAYAPYVRLQMEDEEMRPRSGSFGRKFGLASLL